jgi:hypothetical protein
MVCSVGRGVLKTLHYRRLGPAASSFNLSMAGKQAIIGYFCAFGVEKSGAA